MYTFWEYTIPNFFWGEGKVGIYDICAKLWHVHVLKVGALGITCTRWTGPDHGWS